MSEDLKYVYDFVCRQEEMINKIVTESEKTGIISATRHFQGQSQMAWNIKTFIEENFICNS